MTPTEKLQKKINEATDQMIFCRDYLEAMTKMFQGYEALCTFFEDHDVPVDEWLNYGYTSNHRIHTNELYEKRKVHTIVPWKI